MTNQESELNIVVIDTDTGQSGPIEAWVERFAQLWSQGAECRDEFVTLLSRRVRLVAPGLAPTAGRDAGLNAFRRTFDALPDLTAAVISWAARGNVVFLELRFRATIGGRTIEWPAVDRFLFEGGEAVERVIHFDRTPLRQAYFGSVRGLLQLWKLRRIREKK
ncbi:MAG: nuclear transport factor 2 family protein [Sphingopyxis solisilvae]|uniref:nuclear transport factor 2 family protein n=1 Tax=Sphingopyxis solisilvae TaxID=1886788 RepID=UPI0040373A98